MGDLHLIVTHIIEREREGERERGREGETVTFLPDVVEYMALCIDEAVEHIDIDKTTPRQFTMQRWL